MRTAGELQALQNVASEFLSHLDLEATLLSVVHAATEFVGADIAGIMLTEDSGDSLRMRACTGHRTVGTANLQATRGQGLAGKVFETRQPVRVDDYLSARSISRDFFVIAQEEGTRSALGAPMLARGEVIGALLAWRRRPSAFDEVDASTLAGLANLATIAIVNARLYEKERGAVARLEEANRQLEEQYALLRRAASVQDELTNLVLAGKGLSHLVKTVLTHTAGQVAVLDAGLTVLAASAGAEEVTARAVRCIRLGKAAEGEAGGEWAARRAATGGLPDWLLLREVAAGGEHLGHLLLSLEHPPGRFDALVLEQAAIVCALELTKERAVLAARTRVYADFMWDLLDGNIADHAEALVRARYLGYRLPETLRVMLIPIDGVTDWARANGNGARAVDQRREALVRHAERLAQQAAGGPVLAASRGPLLAMIVPAAEGSPAARGLAQHVLEGLGAEHADLELAAGLSECVGLSPDLRQARSQAQHALSAAPLIASNPPIALFDELGVLRFLLAPGDRSDLWGFARKLLGPVLDYDRDHPSNLLETIEAYLASDCHLQRTADRLYMHAKTVRYRLDRVERLADLDLSRQQDRFDAQLAITILRALSLEDAQP